MRMAGHRRRLPSRGAGRPSACRGGSLCPPSCPVPNCTRPEMTNGPAMRGRP